MSFCIFLLGGGVVILENLLTKRAYCAEAVATLFGAFFVCVKALVCTLSLVVMTKVAICLEGGSQLLTIVYLGLMSWSTPHRMVSLRTLLQHENPSTM